MPAVNPMATERKILYGKHPLRVLLEVLSFLFLSYLFVHASPHYTLASISEARTGLRMEDKHRLVVNTKVSQYFELEV